MLSLPTGKFNTIPSYNLIQTVNTYCQSNMFPMTMLSYLYLLFLLTGITLSVLHIWRTNFSFTSNLFLDIIHFGKSSLPQWCARINLSWLSRAYYAQFHVQWHQFGGLKLAMMGAFPPWKSANANKSGLLFFSENWLLNINQHTTALPPPHPSQIWVRWLCYGLW